MQTDKQDKNDNTAKVLKIIARLLLIHFEINAVIVPAKAETNAIKDKTMAEECISIKQKSCKNLFPITLCKT